MRTGRKKKRKPIRYKPVVFMLTSRQKKSLEKHCRSKGTTMIKLIKKSIYAYLNLPADEKPVDYISPNQLDLFENQTVEYLRKHHRK